MKRLVVLSVLLLSLLCGSSRAANNPSPALDAVASYIAGHPVSVWCETDWSSWATMTQNNGVSDAGGFTRIGDPVVYFAPDICGYLHALVNHEDVGSFFFSDAVLLLVHESVHQRGITDEGVTDCTALGLVKDTVTRFFGVPQTISQPYIGTAIKRIAGKLVKVPVVKTHSIVNPFLAHLFADAKRWHVAKPANYQGGC